MARSRVLKPEFFRNEVLCTLSHATRLLYAGLWGLADREGRLEDRPKRIAVDVFPYEDLNVEAMLEDLDEAGFIVRYVAAGRPYIAIPTFLRHQVPHLRERPSLIPAPAADSAKNGEHQPRQVLSTNLGIPGVLPRSPVSVSVSVSDPVSDPVSVSDSGSDSDPVSHAARADVKPAGNGKIGKIHAIAYEVQRLNPNASAETLIDTLQWTVRQQLKITLNRYETIQYLKARGSL